jgi:chromosomal replication initiation ATPase DnaA
MRGRAPPGIADPDEEQQRAALRLRAHLRGFDLPEETAHYLLRRLPAT